MLVCNCFGAKAFFSNVRINRFAPLSFAVLVFFCGVGVNAIRSLSREHGLSCGVVASDWSLHHTIGL